MSATVSGRGPVLRGVTAAVVAVVAAALAHAATGGPVAPGAALWSLALLAGPAWWLARRERGFAVLAAAQLGGQQVAHALLGGGVHPGHDGLLPPELMLHAHVVAAVLAGLWLRGGERRAFAVVRDAVRAVVLLVAGSPAPTGVPTVRTLPVAAAHPVTRLAFTVARRGPPLPA